MKQQGYVPQLLFLTLLGISLNGQPLMASQANDAASKKDESKASTYLGKWVHPIQLNGQRYLPSASDSTRTISYYTNPKGSFHYTIGEILGNIFYFHKTFESGEKHQFKFNLDTNEVIDLKVENGEGANGTNKYRIWTTEAEEFVAALKAAGSIKKV